MEEELICPWCLVRIGQDGKCPRCGKDLDKGDWHCNELEKEGLAPYLPANLDKPDSEGQYRPNKPKNPGLKGVLPEGCNCSLDAKSCHRIGSSPHSDIVIDGEESLSAVILRIGDTEQFYIYDCGSISGIRVNGDLRHGCELKSGDRITIAGIDMKLREAAIMPYVDEKGMSISVNHLTFSVEGRDAPILDDVSFSASPGEFIAVLGPSGCGKSSLVQCLVGLAETDDVEICVNGIPLDDAGMGYFLSSTAYLPQNVEEMLHDFLTVEDEMDIFRRIHLEAGDDDECENREYLTELGMLDKLGRRVGDLSGGEKKRVGIALALLRKPQLLLLDEPSAGLDPAAESELIDLLRKIANNGRTVLCVTHILSNIEKFDKVIALSKGRMAYFGPPSGLLGKFGVDNYSAMYDILSEGNCERVHFLNEGRACEEMEFRQASAPSLWRRIGGYLSRFAKDIFAKRSTVGFMKKCRLFSMPALLFLWQPLCLVVGLRLACACYFRSNGGRSVDLELLGFCAALSMFWIGINNSAREFVKERVPGRCLERLNQVPMEAYVLSKLIWTVFVCVLQSVSFTVLFCIAGEIPVPLAETVDVPALSVSPLWFGPLLISCLTGAFFGLAISASAKKQLSAISVVPNVAIMALLFSNAVVQFENGNGYYSPIAKWICTAVMPCHWASKVLDSIQFGASATQSIVSMLAQFVLYVCISIFVIMWRQDKNERDWNGRN